MSSGARVDVGWVTGHSYIVYGPLANGATTLMFEGVPTYPDAGRFWEVIAKQVTQILYRAHGDPLAHGAGDGPGREARSSSLPALGSVGDESAGVELVAANMRQGQLPDRRHLLADRDRGPHHPPRFPGRSRKAQAPATKPFFGVRPVVLDAATGKEQPETETEGVLCIADSWPGQMRTLWGDHALRRGLFRAISGAITSPATAAVAMRIGYYWITGRVDDVLNVSGTPSGHGGSGKRPRGPSESGQRGRGLSA